MKEIADADSIPEMAPSTERENGSPAKTFQFASLIRPLPQTRNLKFSKSPHLTRFHVTRLH